MVLNSWLWKIGVLMNARPDLLIIGMIQNVKKKHGQNVKTSLNMIAMLRKLFIINKT